MSNLNDYDKTNNTEFSVIFIKPLKDYLKKYNYYILNFEEQLNLYNLLGKTKAEAYRKLLQYVGTNIIRKRNKNHWMDILYNKILLYKDNDIVIDDIRFKNEFDLIQHMDNSITIKIIRNNNDNDSHISENELDIFNTDYIINNNGTIEDLYDKIDKIVNNGG